MRGVNRKVYIPSQERSSHTIEHSEPSQVVESVTFGFMTDEDVRKHSVIEITNPIFMSKKERTTKGGLYCQEMGPLEYDCKHCGLLRTDCQGHCGHIEFVFPIYHPLMFNLLYSFLERTCFSCHHFMAGKEDVERYVSQLKLITGRDIVAANQFNSDMGKQRWTSLQFAELTDVMNKFLSSKPEECKNCRAASPKLEKPIFGWVRLADGTNEEREKNLKVCEALLEQKDSRDFSPAKVKDLLKDLWTNESEFCSFIGDLWLSGSKKKDYSMFFMQNVLVPPTKFRPPTKEGDSVINFLRMILYGSLYFPSYFWSLCSFYNCWHCLCGSLSVFSRFSFSHLYISCVVRWLFPLTPVCLEVSYDFCFLQVMDHPQTLGLNKILQSSITLRNAHTKRLDPSKIIYRWMNLQKSVNVLFDSKTATVQGQKEVSRICQLLEKKEGLFRHNMMGKRVSHACRSVISPDPYIAVNEIGIPLRFALALTYPERVTPWNAEKLRGAIANPDIHPGAAKYQGKNSIVLWNSANRRRTVLGRNLLSRTDTTTEFGKTNNDDFEDKIVYRHMQDGDVVLVNSQPTLHKPSIMAHIVRVLKGDKTLRLHYANCSAYNADFDGDEMNVHFPQDEISRAEAYNIVNANNQYARPSNGCPLRALIQDHIVSSVLLTKRDTFLDKDEFCQLFVSSGVTDMVVSSFSGRSGKKVMVSASDAELLIVTPAILKPVPLWTGKQVITAVLTQITKGHPPFTVEKATKLPVDFFKCRSREVQFKKNLTKQDTDESWKQDLNEDKLLIRKNEFVCGVFDKAQFADYGLVHTVHELYGSNAAGNLLSAFSRLFTVFLQIHGFTCGVDDLIILKDMDEKRKKQLQQCEQVGEKVLRKTFGIDINVQIDTQDMKSRIERIICEDGKSALASLDRSIINKLNQCSDKGVMNNFLSDGLLKTPGKNCVSLMTLSGAKGSKEINKLVSRKTG